MNDVPLLPIIVILLIFGVPYLVIYLQSQKLATLTAKIEELSVQMMRIEASLKNGRNDA